MYAKQYKCTVSLAEVNNQSVIMRKASTSTGLKTTVNVIRRAYETGRKIADDFKTNMTIVFDELLSIWNYRAVPG